MAESESGYKWWIRYVFVPVITGGGVIAVLAAHYFQQQGNSEPEPARPVSIASAPAALSTTPSEPEPTRPIPTAAAPTMPPPPPESKATSTTPKEVRTVSIDWLMAVDHGDVDRLIELSSMPFFFEGSPIILSESLLRTQYTDFLFHAAFQAPELRSITIRTVRQVQQTESWLAQLPDYLDLLPTDYVVQLKLRARGSTIDHGAWLVIRKTDSTIRVAGFRFTDVRPQGD